MRYPHSTQKTPEQQHSPLFLFSSVAFDTVNYHILLTLLSNMGIYGLILTWKVVYILPPHHRGAPGLSAGPLLFAISATSLGTIIHKLHCLPVAARTKFKSLVCLQSSFQFCTHLLEVTKSLFSYSTAGPVAGEPRICLRLPKSRLWDGRQHTVYPFACICYLPTTALLQ